MRKQKMVTIKLTVDNLAFIKRASDMAAFQCEQAMLYARSTEQFHRYNQAEDALMFLRHVAVLLEVGRVTRTGGMTQSSTQASI